MPDHADPATDAILDHALQASEAFRQELLDALEERLAPLWEEGNADLILAEARAVLERHVGPLAGLITAAGLASWLHGAASVVEDLPSGSLPKLVATEPPRWAGMKAWEPVVEGAVDSLRELSPVTHDEFEAMADASRREAFTVAYEASAAAVEKVRDAVADAVERGYSFDTFKDMLKGDLDTSKLGTGALENVFRTASAKAYSVGMDRLLSDPVVSETFPFEETVPIKDSRLTPLCEVVSRSGIQGTGVYLRDDPIYQKFKPPRHWRCRCSRRALSVEDAARRGIKYAQEWLEKGEQPPDPPYVEHPPVDLPPGWVPSVQMSLANGEALPCWEMSWNRA